MKKTAYVVSLCALMMGASGLAHAETTPLTVDGSVVHFVGSIVDAPCSLDNDSVEQKVELGQYRTANFTKTGDVSGEKSFKIHLTDCDVSTYKNAAITFTGNSVSGNTKALAVESDGVASAASGVGIQILQNGKPVTIDGSAATSSVALTGEDNYLPFAAQYISVADSVTPGQANADANFSITYN